MIIEAMVRWTEMRIKPTDQEESKMKKLINGEDSPEFVPEFYYQLGPMIFDLKDVARFNRSYDGKSVTIRFSDGETCVLDMSYEDFRDLFIQTTGMAVHSTIREPSKAKVSKKAASDRDIPKQQDNMDGFGL